MQIETIKQTQNGYLVNGLMSVPNDPANSDYQAIQKWIANGGIVEPEFTDAELLANAKAKKKAAIKALRDSNLEKPTPQVVIYGGNLSNRSFNISVKIHLPIFESIIAGLQRKINAGTENPTRGWTDSSGERLNLNINDFRALAIHLDYRDDLEHAQARLKIDILEDLITLEEVEAFDINEAIT